MAALQMAEGADLGADSTVTPGPKTTFGSITASRPITVSWAKKTVSGAVSVTPSPAPRPGRGPGTGLGGGQFGAGVDAQRLGLVAGDHAGRQAARAGQPTMSVR
jgi:hypothetical protein